MATKKYRPGRRLVVFFAGVAVLFGLVALNDTWKPALGLDLQGGTRITLIATGSPKAENLEQARQIIDNRVNGSGVAEADVNTQGNRFIIVEIPGESRRDLIDTVKQTAQLRFRIVAMIGNGLPVIPEPSPSATPSPSSSPSSSPSTTPAPSPSGSTANRAAPSLADEPVSSCKIATPADSGVIPVPPKDATKRVENAIAWAKSPGMGFKNAAGKCETYAEAFLTYTCPQDGDQVAKIEDDSDRPLITCDEDGQKFLLSYAVVEGTALKSASAGIPQTSAEWVVSLELKGKDGEARPVSDFAKVSRDLFNSTGQFTAYPSNVTKGQFAIALDGTVISNAGFNGIINNGQAEISGGFDETSANALATSLKFGALPIAFEDDPSTETIGPSLAGNQLSTGLWAAAFGFGLVMLYCLFYYRGLGLVVLLSLLVAAGITYAMVLLLSEAAGFTLTLPGMAGLIIGVGVTADSFVIFFERIRDEMREGRSMRVAVETGWTRARKTRMAANVVSLLSAGVLYFFATGVVKGFGFALGLSTLIDLAVLFWFTKHAVSWLAQFQFFNGGGALSGLSRSTLGLDAEPQGGRL